LPQRGPATATGLAGRLPVPRQTIAKHLVLLAEAGLVRAERGERRRVRCRLRPAPMQVAWQFLAAKPRDWDGPPGVPVGHPGRGARRPAPARSAEPEDIMADDGCITTVAAARTAALTATLGLAAASWVVAVWQMHGMDMGVATRLGSFASFTAVWVVMMAAMMLPGAAPAVLRRARASGSVRDLPPFIGSCLAVWVLAGAAVYALDRPHGPVAAGVVVIAAGVYEVTPVTRQFRSRCREDAGSGLRFGLCCAGSSIGLMGILVALGVMSLFWMAVIAVLTCAQKLLPSEAAIDVPPALAIAGLGLVIVIAPSQVPGLTPPMM
jgi:predicted metal-binding membrane protein